MRARARSLSGSGPTQGLHLGLDGLVQEAVFSQPVDRIGGRCESIDQLAVFGLDRVHEIERRVDADVVVWRDEIGHVVTTIDHLTGYAQEPTIQVTTQGP